MDSEGITFLIPLDNVSIIFKQSFKTIPKRTLLQQEKSLYFCIFFMMKLKVKYSLSIHISSRLIWFSKVMTDKIFNS